MRSCLSLLVATVAVPFALVGCAADSDAPADTANTESAVSSAPTIFHGTVSVDFMSALTPDSRLHTPWAWDLGVQEVVVVPAVIDSEHPVHSWDIEVKDDDAKLQVWSESIKTYANGKPDMRGSNVRSTYGVADIDTVLTLFKKENGAYRFIGKNDDGIYESKGSWLERNVVKGGVYHVVVEAKSHDTRGVIGLYIGSAPQHPSDP
jgi:hypothetical protein